MTKPRIGGPAAVVLFLGASCAVLFVGLTVSKGTDDWTWLSRAGSVLVVLGIVFAYFNIDGFIERSIRGAVRRLTTKKARDNADPSNWVVTWLAEDPAEIPRRVKTLEVAVIALGTLIWGFGDLLGTG
ncbi:MAG: hypothetical protein ABJ388_11735 [Alphaproteobacteria bacterium]|tara:strand:- start:514 stop:897 length:384 start_codon:yes stop_codon:yes gene_type:complete